MVFSSVTFLFIFLPLVLFFYFVIPKKFRSARNYIFLLFSLAFYFYGEPKGIFIMLLSIAGNYLFAILVGLRPKTVLMRRLAVIFSILFNLGILGFYKYTGFILTNIQNLFEIPLTIPEIIMPIGISFFTFQGMSYVFDVAKGEVPAEKNILKVALYISMFPPLVAGPIVRYESIAQEITQREENFSLFYDGICRFIIGMAKKMILANCFGQIIQDATWMSQETISGMIQWVHAILYTFQIYYDFSGYSDMAIGLGMMFGFHFPENFNYPYVSSSITEFWRRWHISLSAWFRDYVYIPLGGSRCGKTRQLINIVIVWVLTGFWHGASWNFIAWGLYFALLLMIEKLFLLKLLKKVWRPIAHLYALFFIVLGWVIFSGTGMAEIFKTFRSMFQITAVTQETKAYMTYVFTNFKFEILAAVLFSMPIYPIIKKRFEKTIGYRLIFSLCILVLFAWSMLSIVNSNFNPFIYFRF